MTREELAIEVVEALILWECCDNEDMGDAWQSVEEALAAYRQCPQ